MNKNIISFIFIFIFFDNLFASVDLLKKAEIAKKNGNFTLAKKYYYDFFTKKPESSLAPFAMYNYALINQSFNDSIKYLKKIVDIYPNFVGIINVFEKLGILYYLKENYKECIKNFDYILKSSISKDKQKQKARYYIGKAYIFLGNIPKAKYFFDLIIENSNSDYISFAKYEIGEIYFKEKKIDKAKEIFEEILREYPESEAEIKAVYKLADIFILKKNFNKAKAALEYLIKTYPYSIEASFANKKLKTLYNTINLNDKNFILSKKIKKIKFAIHLGNFRNRVYVLNLFKKLVANDYSAFIVEKHINNIKFWSLLVGDYDNRSIAVKDANTISKNFKIRAKVIVRK